MSRQTPYGRRLGRHGNPGQGSGWSTEHCPLHAGCGCGFDGGLCGAIAVNPVIPRKSRHRWLAALGSVPSVASCWGRSSLHVGNAEQKESEDVFLALVPGAGAAAVLTQYPEFFGLAFGAWAVLHTASASERARDKTTILFLMSQHRSLRAAATLGGKRNVLKRFERLELLKKRGQWKPGDRITGLRKTKGEA